MNAWEHDETSWAELKATYRERGLRTTCCDHTAVPKTSKLGSFFFAHARRGECTSAPETHEHLLAKSVIARAARDAGWDVTTELRGAAPNGQTWVADVHAQRGSARVAFEVQWSPQTLEESTARQARYAASGIRGLWLLRQGRDDVRYGGYDRHATPMFQLEHKEGRFSVGPFGVKLDAFVRGALAGGLVWWPKPGLARLGLVVVREPCWKCKRVTSLLLGVQIAHPGRDEVSTFIGWGDWDQEEDKKMLLPLLTPQLLAQFRLGIIKPRASKTAGGVYVSQGCAHCDALQGDFFIQRLRMEYVYDEAVMQPTTWVLVRVPQEALKHEAEWHFHPVIG